METIAVELDSCAFGHQFAKLKDHPNYLDSKDPVCPHCTGESVRTLLRQEKKAQACIADLRSQSKPAKLLELRDENTRLRRALDDIRIRASKMVEFVSDTLQAKHSS